MCLKKGEKTNNLKFFILFLALVPASRNVSDPTGDAVIVKMLKTK